MFRQYIIIIIIIIITTTTTSSAHFNRPPCLKQPGDTPPQPW
jgi:hypothetical protein